MILAPSNPLIILGVEPIRVVGPSAAGATHSGGGTFPWMLMVGIMLSIALLVALGVFAMGALAAYRRIRTLHPEEQAFRAVCRALRIPSTHWSEIRSLAKRIDAAPVALLISKTAFDRAAGGGSRSSGSSSGLVSLRSRLFGDDPPL